MDGGANYAAHKWARIKIQTFALAVRMAAIALPLAAGVALAEEQAPAIQRDYINPATGYTQVVAVTSGSTKTLYVSGQIGEGVVTLTRDDDSLMGLDDGAMFAVEVHRRYIDLARLLGQGSGQIVSVALLLQRRLRHFLDRAAFVVDPQVLADRTHTGRQAVLNHSNGWQRLGIPRQAWHGVVAAPFVVHRPDNGTLVHPLCRARQQLTDLDTRRVARDRFKLAADAAGCIGLQVIRFKL